MTIYKGSLVYEDYYNLVKDNLIKHEGFENSQIQPSSVDLTLSEECYEISSSFLSPSKRVEENISEYKIRKINLKNKYIFEKNKTYLVKLNENLSLPKYIFGLCNPKSSTGRLDIFCRTILNYCDEYEKIPSNYNGEMYIEITSRSFPIEFQKGDSLNQMRLVMKDHNRVSDEEIKTIHNKDFITLDENNSKIMPKLKNGLTLSVNLASSNKVNAYIAKDNTPTLIFGKIKQHSIKDFWNPINTKNNKIIIKKNNFYILKSKEKIQIPKNMAGEMIPYDTSLGDFRAHYAGFFDPGFGKDFGSCAVLEVKTSEIDFVLEHEQSIARIVFEKLNKNTDNLYGSNLNSNYQHQGLALSKHFV
ncbi:2'-deoxycytidine 5'-triphosphate deaminase [Alphaproteobacteria bacterium]|nr:2'-deoxycytidine 5'-triphosphate deaminase [Alphaproteobacteria bacterium]